MSSIAALDAHRIFIRPNCRLYLLSRVDSTNDFLSRLPPPPSKHIQICLAEEQTAGKGRRGHHWHSPFGQNIYLSLRTWLNAKHIHGLSLAISARIADYLHTLQVQPQLKWPNDILLAGQKLAGLLIENQSKSGRHLTTVGFGLNVFLKQAEIDQAWTSLVQHSPLLLDRNQIASQLIEIILNTLTDYTTNQGLEPFISLWQKYEIYRNQRVILFGSKPIYGIYKGINEEGALLLERNGSMAVFHSGQLSLRPETTV